MQGGKFLDLSGGRWLPWGNAIKPYFFLDGDLTETRSWSHPLAIFPLSMYKCLPGSLVAGGWRWGRSYSPLTPPTRKCQWLCYFYHRPDYRHLLYWLALVVMATRPRYFSTPRWASNCPSLGTVKARMWCGTHDHGESRVMGQHGSSLYCVCCLTSLYIKIL